MNEIVQTLFLRLYAKGLTPVEIPRLIKDVLNIVGDGGVISVVLMKQDLGRLGWDESVMDLYIFELIMYYLEIEGCFKVRKCAVN